SFSPTISKWRRRQLDDIHGRLLQLQQELRAALPGIDRGQEPDRSVPARLQEALPADAAFVDLLKYARTTYGPGMPGLPSEARTENYVAFVVTKKAVHRVDLGEAKPIEMAVAGWRAVIAKTESDGAFPATLRQR